MQGLCLCISFAVCIPKHVLTSSNAIHNVIPHYAPPTMCAPLLPPLASYPQHHPTANWGEKVGGGARSFCTGRPRAAANLPQRTSAVRACRSPADDWRRASAGPRTHSNRQLHALTATSAHTYTLTQTHIKTTHSRGSEG